MGAVEFAAADLDGNLVHVFYDFRDRWRNDTSPKAGRRFTACGDPFQLGGMVASSGRTDPCFGSRIGVNLSLACETEMFDQTYKVDFPPSLM